MLIGEYLHNIDAKKRLAVPAKLRKEIGEKAILTRSGAVEVELDQLGRILVPDYLKEYAGLAQKVTIVGVQNRLEIWDTERWENYKKEVEKKADMIAEKLGELGLY
ncbi:MAG: Protein MraZ [Parcubacteria group bacterium GW2011_GWA2_45_30]|nr:MAG: Protein MraZ [Parcubacteria group bacterium GW2011_GWA2_45_30]